MSSITALAPFLLVIGVGFLLGIGIEKFFAHEGRAEWRRRNAGRWKKNKAAQKGAHLTAVPKRTVIDSADQLRTVMKAHFDVQPLLNKSEARVFQALDRMVIARNPGWQVMAQVSLGEMLRCKIAPPMAASTRSASTSY